MKISNGFFVIEKATKGPDHTLQLAGHVLIGATIESGPSSTAEPSKPPIQIHLPHPLKWILPPRESAVYGAVKAFAEGMGYDTVEHDDFSYPPPR